MIVNSTTIGILRGNNCRTCTPVCIATDIPRSFSYANFPEEHVEKSEGVYPNG